MRYIFFLSIFIISLQSCSEDPRCNDGVRNGNETFIDCGGNCDPCFTCDDGILNQGEHDIDCGGPCPNLCTNVNSWETLDLPDVNHKQIHFSNQLEGLLLTDNAIWRTNNQGDSWSIINTNFNISYFYWMKIINENLAFILADKAGEVGYRLYKVTNHFNDWQEFGINLPTTDLGFRPIFDLAAQSENNILVSHEYAHGQIYLSRTTDGGNSWEVIFDSADYISFNLDQITGLQYHLSNTIYAFHENIQIISTDNGQSWSTRALPPEIQINYSTNVPAYNSVILFYDKNNAVFNTRNNRIWFTNDSGLTWTVLENINNNLTTWAIFDYLLLEDGRKMVVGTPTCLQSQLGYCSIAWISDESSQNWDRHGLVPSFGIMPFSELQPQQIFYFDEATFLLDPFLGKFLRLK